MRLNPLHPGLYLVHRSRALFILGRYEEALAQIERAVVGMPAHANALALLAACYASLGRMTDARNAVQRVRVASPDFTLGYIRKTLSYANAADLDMLCSLLETAGLPK